MTQTLDQQRAAFAWQAASQGIARHHEDYRRLAKGAPALIMTSGLMPTLAFYAGKGNAAKGNAADLLTDDIVRWLSERIFRQTLQPGQGGRLFSSLMDRMQTGDSSTYLRATDEALEILKWIRQFVDAVEK